MSGGAERLREMVAEATQGPWLADPDLAEYDAGLHNVWHGDAAKPDLRAVAHDIFKFEDAELIALAPELAALVADMADVLERIAYWAEDELLSGPPELGLILGEARILSVRFDALLPEREPA